MYKIVYIVIASILSVLNSPTSQLTSPLTSPQLPQVSIRDTINSEIVKGFFDSDTVGISKNIYLIK
jgi:hypothetical protein